MSSDEIQIEDYFKYYDWNSITNWTRDPQSPDYYALISNELIEKGQEVIFTFEGNIPVDSQFGISGARDYVSVLRLKKNGTSTIHSNTDRTISIAPQNGDVFSVKIVGSTAYWYKNGIQIHSNTIKSGGYNIRLLIWYSYSFSMNIKIKS